MTKAKVNTVTVAPPSNEMLKFCRVINNIVRRNENERDLTFRQVAVLLICYTEAEPQTVRGLAARLELHKPAITRSLDRLSDYKLIERRTDVLDRRSVLTVITKAGQAFMRQLQDMLAPVHHHNNTMPPVTVSDKNPKGVIANTVKAMRKRGIAKVHVTIDATKPIASSAEISPAKTAKKRTRSTSVVRHGE